MVMTITLWNLGFIITDQYPWKSELHNNFCWNSNMIFLCEKVHGIHGNVYLRYHVNEVFLWINMAENWIAGNYKWTTSAPYFKIIVQTVSQFPSFPLTHNRRSHCPPSPHLHDLILCNYGNELSTTKHILLQHMAINNGATELINSSKAWGRYYKLLHQHLFPSVWFLMMSAIVCSEGYYKRIWLWINWDSWQECWYLRFALATTLATVTRSFPSENCS
jgi:hypothetical protein